MSVLRAITIMLLLCASSRGQGTTYRDPKCQRICSFESDFETPLPPHPRDDDTSRVHKWGIVLLNQIRDNIGDLTPPGVARTLAVFSSCLHDVIALGSENMRPAFVPHAEFDYGDSLADAVDGAGFQVLQEMFEEKPSFSKVVDFVGEDHADTLSKHPSGVTSMSTLSYSSGSSSFTSNKTIRTTPFPGSKGGESFEKGRNICRKVIAVITLDGFDALGNPGPDITSKFPDHEPFNYPQTRPGITDCAAEMRSLDRWQPLCVPVAFGSDECTIQEFLAPFADKMTTFALPSPESVSPDGPPLLEAGDREEYFRQTKEVVSFSQNLSDITKITAEHWADGPDSTAPPGHWFRIAMESSLNKVQSVFETIKVLFVVSNALNDAGVAAWGAKIKFDSIRPLQMIQCGLSGETLDAWKGPYQGVGDVPAPLWQPYQAATFVTPAFAGYVSGHSTFSAAAGRALFNIFGPEYVAPKCRRVPAGESLFEKKINPGEPGFISGVTDFPNTGPRTTGYVPARDVVLCWETWEEAAVEAGISRLMGGIHIIADHIDGERMGLEIGDMVFEKASRLWN